MTIANLLRASNVCVCNHNGTKYETLIAIVHASAKIESMTLFADEVRGKLFSVRELDPSKLTCKLITALSYKMWNVRKSEISITETNKTASFGRDTPMISMKSVELVDEVYELDEVDSCPFLGLISVFDNHLKQYK